MNGGNLDISTPRGQQTLADELIAIEMFEAQCPGFHYIKTKKDRIAIVDGVVERNRFTVGLVETKCRYGFNLQHFETTWQSKWLVTYDKIEGGRRLADYLMIPYWGFLYIVDDKVLLTKKLYDPEAGGWQTSFEVLKTPTQRSCNGGEALRDNAYIDMRGATVIRSAA